MMDVIILIYWNVDILYYVFNVVVVMMVGVGFVGLLKMVFIFVIGIGMFVYLVGKQFEMVIWFFQVLIFVMLLNMLIVCVILIDKINFQLFWVVVNVFFVMVVVGQMVNMIFGFIIQQYEMVFGVFDMLGFE